MLLTEEDYFLVAWFSSSEQCKGEFMTYMIEIHIGPLQLRRPSIDPYVSNPMFSGTQAEWKCAFSLVADLSYLPLIISSAPSHEYYTAAFSSHPPTILA